MGYFASRRAIGECARTLYSLRLSACGGGSGQVVGTAEGSEHVLQKHSNIGIPHRLYSPARKRVRYPCCSISVSERMSFYRLGWPKFDRNNLRRIRHQTPSRSAHIRSIPGRIWPNSSEFRPTSNGSVGGFDEVKVAGTLGRNSTDAGEKVTPARATLARSDRPLTNIGRFRPKHSWNRPKFAGFRPTLDKT